MTDTEFVRRIYGMKEDDWFTCDKCREPKADVRWIPAIQNGLCLSCWPKKAPKRKLKP